MITMLEKAARAFFEAHPWGDLDDCGPLHTWETLPDEWREYYRKGTRAVLLAIREPGHNGSVWGEHNAANFTAMIDAILGDQIDPKR